MIVEREIYQKIKPYFNSSEVIVVTGMRRTGKTTLLKFVYDQITSHNRLCLDLENPINRKYFEEEDYEKIKFNFEIKGINFQEKAFIFLDEIQFVKNLSSVVKYLYDHYKIKFFLTGSSSFYIKNLFSESLAGRKYIFELFPLTFKEFLLFKDEKLIIPSGEEKISKTVFDTFSNLYEEYLRFGGFPGVVQKDSFQEKKMALEDIFSSYFQLEVIQLSDYKKTSVVRDLILLLMQRIGSKVDVQKLSSELGVSRPTLYEYLSFLEDTYFITLVKSYSKNKDAEIRSQEKVYVCDSGLVNNLVQVDEGSLFENNVFNALRFRGPIHYYQKRGGAEVDFILNKEEAYEVKLTPTHRDGARLRKISTELGMKNFSLVSKNYSELEKVRYGFNV